jgi:transcriptional regulator with XRE-family HTH domain
MIVDNRIELDRFDPQSIMEGMAQRLRQLRIAKHLTQELLAQRSGVTLGSVKRFELSHEISLKNLLKLAVVLEATEAFHDLFSHIKYRSIDDILKAEAVKPRKRAGHVRPR